MSQQFDNAPLLELVAELRWQSADRQTVAPANGQAPVPMRLALLSTGSVEEFLRKFGAEVYGIGYKRAERIVPPGFPIVAHQAVLRFRKESEEEKSEMLQVGPGMFS